jgi:hypothetical protein
MMVALRMTCPLERVTVEPDTSTTRDPGRISNTLTGVGGKFVWLSWFKGTGGHRLSDHLREMCCCGSGRRIGKRFGPNHYAHRVRRRSERQTAFDAGDPETVRGIFGS